MGVLPLLVLMQTGILLGQTPPVHSSTPTAGTRLSLPEIIPQLPGLVEPSTHTPTGPLETEMHVSTPLPRTALALSTPAQTNPFPGPWTVQDIALEGLQNVKEKVVLGNIKAKKGQVYSQDDISRDIQALLGLGFFSRAEAETLEVPAPQTGPLVYPPIRLVYKFQERPRIKKIEWKGQKALSKSKLEETVSLKAKDPYDESRLKEDVGKILDQYREKGYTEAKVETSTAPVETNQAILTFNITEGIRVLVRDVDLSGVRDFKEKKILKQMKTKRKKVFNARTLKEDLENIEKFYKNRGYLLFKSSEPAVTYSEDRTGIRIVIGIQEGRKFSFGSTSFEGNTLFSDAELRSAISYKEGKLFNQEKYDETRAKFQERYADKGYLRALIVPEQKTDESQGKVDVVFHIQEGGIVFVDHIDVEGNTYTKTYVIRREIRMKEGEPFSAAKVRKSQEKIINLGFIEDVQIDIQSPQDPNRADITFEVKEGRPGMFSAGAGFSSVDKLVGTLTLQHMNLFGRAHRLSLSWEFGSRVQNYDITWTNPWMGDHPISWGFSAFNTRRKRQFETTTTGFKEERKGGSVQLGPRFQDDMYQLSLRYKYEQVEVFDVLEEFKPFITEGKNTTSSFYTEFARDTRDNVWDPNTGNRNGLAVELAGGPLGGTVDFYRPTISSSWFFHLFSIADYPFVFSLANRTGYIKQYGSSRDVPVFERFYIGGGETVRGYSARGEVGPPEGGKVYTVFNAEYKFPLVREKKMTILQFALFTDLGTSWRNFNETQFSIGSRAQDLKAGAGFGIRFKTPVFPVRLDWGYGLNHREGESKTQIYFTIGNIF